MSERERAIGLYIFLKEFAQLRTRPVRDVATYERDGAVTWVADIPRERGCECIARYRAATAGDNDDEPDPEDSANSAAAWLKIRRPRVPPPPALPEVAREWARQDQIENSSIDLPEPSTTIPAESADHPPLRIEDHPDVQAAWDDWVETSWWAWAERDRREQAVRQVYADLFRDAAAPAGPRRGVRIGVRTRPPGLAAAGQRRGGAAPSCLHPRRYRTRP